MNKKRCKECNLLKDVSEFYGVQGDCKECYKKRIRKYYQENKEKIKLYDVERNKLASRKAKRLDYQRKQRKNKPEKYLARQKTQRALANGTLKKLPCKICGISQSEAHHPDYRSPLKVKWLCRKHHLELHNKKSHEN